MELLVKCFSLICCFGAEDKAMKVLLCCHPVAPVGNSKPFGVFRTRGFSQGLSQGLVPMTHEYHVGLTLRSFLHICHGSKYKFFFQRQYRTWLQIVLLFISACSGEKQGTMSKHTMSNIAWIVWLEKSAMALGWLRPEIRLRSTKITPNPLGRCSRLSALGIRNFRQDQFRIYLPIWVY